MPTRANDECMHATKCPMQLSGSSQHPEPAMIAAPPSPREAVRVARPSSLTFLKL